jgi:hypothetical protein
MFHPARDRSRRSTSHFSCAGSQERRTRIQRFRAGELYVVAARLIRPVLPRVEHRDARERAICKWTVQLKQRASWQRRAPERHVLVVRLVSRRAAQRELLDRRAVFVVPTGVVVVDFVIVPDDEERKQRVHRAQRRIAPVLRVAVAVIVEGQQLAADVLPHELVSAGVLVDVVAEVHHQIEIFLGHVLVRREQADLEMLARRDGEPEPIDVRLRARKRARPADGTHLAAGAELVPVPAVGLEPCDFDVNRVRPIG